MTDHKPSKSLPKATAKRLPQYYRLFKSLVEENVTRTNSQLISEKIGVDAATIRRDFSLFGELGRRGYGYETKVLRDFFGELLGQDQRFDNELFSARYWAEFLKDNICRNALCF